MTSWQSSAHIIHIIGPDPRDVLGPYELVAVLGAGGMGEVWKARDTRLDRVVAIKRLTGQHSERFEQEARAIAALNHPHICQIYDVGPDYLVLEYVEGQRCEGPFQSPRRYGLRYRSRAPSRRPTAMGFSTAI